LLDLPTRFPLELVFVPSPGKTMLSDYDLFGIFSIEYRGQEFHAETVLKMKFSKAFKDAVFSPE
jgi:hypothetical protein